MRVSSVVEEGGRLLLRGQRVGVELEDAWLGVGVGLGVRLGLGLGLGLELGLGLGLG